MKDREMGDRFQICVFFQAMTVLYSASIPHPSRRPPNPQPLEDSIKLFNEGLNNSCFLYKLHEVNLPPRQADSRENNSLSFVIKETVCRKSEEIPGECPFKEGGVMKNCTAVYSGPGQEKAELSCQTLDPPPQASGLPPTTSEGAAGDRSGQSHHKAEFINSGKKNEATFLDVIGRNIPGSHLSASCLKCIFDDLPKTHK